MKGQRAIKRQRGKKRRGRPPKEPKDKLAKRLDLRVSEDEKNMFQLAATSSQQDLSVWIRIQLNRAAAEAVDMS